MGESIPLHKPQRPYGFKKGDPKPPNSGRKPGVQNHTTRLLRQATLLAAEGLGSDGKGKGKLVGFLQTFARRHPVEFVQHLLAKLIPMQAVIEASVTPTEKLSLQELEARMKERGLPLQFDAPLDVKDLPQQVPQGVKLN